jgi:hypothetical protein
MMKFCVICFAVWMSWGWFWGAFSDIDKLEVLLGSQMFIECFWRYLDKARKIVWHQLFWRSLLEKNKPIYWLIMIIGPPAAALAEIGGLGCLVEFPWGFGSPVELPWCLGWSLEFPRCFGITKFSWTNGGGFLWPLASATTQTTKRTTTNFISSLEIEFSSNWFLDLSWGCFYIWNQVNPSLITATVLRNLWIYENRYCPAIVLQACWDSFDNSQNQTMFCL